MKANDRARLTTALRDHVAKIAADLRAKMRTSGSAARAAAEQLHKDERVAEDFEVWTDLLSRRAAVLWVLKSVYVRVLEDRGLLQPGRLLDPEAQQLFEKLAPNLGETAFLRWIYKDLASTRGGVPELFSPQPAEVALPSDELSRALIAFWRHRDADSGAAWSFAEEKFEGELMGDLYQELDPVVKDRFALCQTPDFVRTFILDRTLTPAIETFGADEVRLLDPACGSGHFLIDGLKRLVAATAAKHGDWDRAKVVAHALDRVVGIDLNDYACALARTRLIMTAAELAGVTKLADAARFHPHLYWADGLEQVETEEPEPSTQFDLFTNVDENPRATFTRSNVRTALKKVFERKFHAVVANPPYITEKDAARKEYHRGKIGKKQRYVSAYKEYHLSCPFIERAFAVAAGSGFIGVIAGNNFAKGDFGKPLIEKVLAARDVFLVVDASQAYIPHHGTPTILLFARNRATSGDFVRVCLSGRGEDSIPNEPSHGQVWRSIVDGCKSVGFSNEFISVVDVPRGQLQKHPWSLKGGGAAEVQSLLESASGCLLEQMIAQIGAVVLTRRDDVYVVDKGVLTLRFQPGELRNYVAGDAVREWSCVAGDQAVFPYDAQSVPVVDLSESLRCWLRPYRQLLQKRIAFNKTQLERGLAWFEYSMLFRERFCDPIGITFSNVATHNHFAIQREPWLNNSHAPTIKLKPGAQEDDYYALLAVLNSSCVCFWMRQVSKDKGGGTDDGKWQSNPAKVAYEFATNRIKKMPIPKFDSAQLELAGLARELDRLAKERAQLVSNIIPTDFELEACTAQEVLRRLDDAQVEDRKRLRIQVALQEEIDWRIYELYGVVDESPKISLGDLLSSGGADLSSRPFEVRLAKLGHVLGVDGHTRNLQYPGDLAPQIMRVWSEREVLASMTPALAVLENDSFKRRWCVTPKYLAGRVETVRDKFVRELDSRLSHAVERAIAMRATPTAAAQLAASLVGDRALAVLAELASGRRDYDLGELIREILETESVPSSPYHYLTSGGLTKHAVWLSVWSEQHSLGHNEQEPELPVPEYEKADYVDERVYRLRGRLGVPKERFSAYTEVPGRSRAETLYGWAGWTAQQRVKAILAIDEELEDDSVPLADRIGLLDNAWRLLPDVAREDAAAATRLKAELQALVGPEGPSKALIEDWRKRFPPPSARAAGPRKPATPEGEADESLDELPSVIPNVSKEEHAAILIWALLHASGGSATRMDLARAFALRARPALLKKLAPASFKGEVAHWGSVVGSRSVETGLLASTLSALAARNGVVLGTNGEGRATVSTSPHTLAEAQIDAWFRFEAELALKVLRAQPEEKLSAVDKALTGADRKLLEAAA